jgi:long-chain acyl-CoA synthetase
MQAGQGNEIVDSFLAYLPLAHILEMLLELFCIFAGIKIGYGSIRTLTDASVRNCKGDIGTLKPALLAGNYSLILQV